MRIAVINLNSIFSRVTARQVASTKPTVIMKKALNILSLVALATAFSTSAAVAQSGTLIGPHAGYDADVEELFVGANAVFDLPIQLGDATLHGNPEFSYFLIGDDPGVSTSLWTVTLNALYPLTVEFADTYVGAGLAISRWSFDFDTNDFFSKGTGIIIGDLSRSETNLGLNAKVGANFGRESSIKPFAEAGIIIGDGSRIYAQGGARFAI
jgi:opacity protein-like surface antigen